MRYLFLMLASGILLAGCSQSEVKENLGLMREAPDEFRVVSRPPLSVPKEFFLVPPDPGADRAFGLNAEAQARDLVTGGRSGEADTPIEQRQNALAESAAPIVNSSPLASAAEESLLKRAGTDKADASIREKLRNETATEATEEPDMIDRLRGESAGDPVVDAKEEKKRLVTNKKEKKAVNEGEVPVRDPATKSTLERLFE